MKHPTDEEIRKEADSRPVGSIMRHSFSEGAKWVCDQQPKLKPLEWQEDDEPVKFKKYFIAETPFGTSYCVFQNRRGKFYCDYGPNIFAEDCDSIDHGKQLAQADYERRINELYI